MSFIRADKLTHTYLADSHATDHPASAWRPHVCHVHVVMVVCVQHGTPCVTADGSGLL